VGTPARPREASFAVMAGSALVQSAFMVTTLPLSRAVSTSEDLRTARSLNWQLRHQAAVKSMKTGWPAARAAARAGSE
jgi:hypothetical protein